MNQFRTIKPSPVKEITFHLPEIEKFELENGLKILFVRKETLPIIQMNLVVEAGSKYDPADKKGLSNLLAAMLDEGAGEYDSLQLNNEIELLGSVLQVFSDQDSIYVSLLTLTENLPRSMKLFADVIINPRLDENDFQREKRKTIVRILQSKDEPSYVASTVFEKMLYGEENPYSFPESGFNDTVEKIENDDLKKFYQAFIIPNNSTLVVVGNIEKFELQKELHEYLNGWRTSPLTSFKIIPSVKTATKIYFVHKDAAAQSEIRIGQISSPRKSEDYFSKQIMNMILGGQFTSRININLREKKGYTYGAHSSFNYNKDAAHFSVSTSVNNQNTSDAVKEILKELKGIKEQISLVELELAKASIIRKYPSLFETYGHVARNLTNKVIHSLPDDYFNTYIENITKVSLEEAILSANENIFENELVIVIVGDKNILQNQLKDLNLGEIIEVDADGNRIDDDGKQRTKFLIET
ncbi:MAG: pitrilysin family protein [Ignavibacteriales bacterium]|nr:pitrilysin family protein [Ignavibacteriales bacterium]